MLEDVTRSSKLCLCSLVCVWIGFILYDQLQNLSLMVADDGVVVVKFYGLSIGVANGWHLIQPSWNCDDGVMKIIFGSVAMTTVGP